MVWMEAVMGEVGGLGVVFEVVKGCDDRFGEECFEEG